MEWVRLCLCPWCAGTPAEASVCTWRGIPCMNSGNITYYIHAFLQSYIIFSAQKLLWKRFQILKSRLHLQISVAYGSMSRREVTPRMTMSPSSRWTDITTWGETPTYHSQRIYPTKLVLSWLLLKDSSFQRPGFWAFDVPFFSINFLLLFPLLGPGALSTTQVHTPNSLGGREAASLHSHIWEFSGHEFRAVKQHWWGPSSTMSSDVAQTFVLQPQTYPLLPRSLR